MLTSRLEAVFDEFLDKVKDEFKMARISEIDHSKIRKVPVNPNYGFKEEKTNRLDEHPSFMLKKKNLLPGWYTPMESYSTELKSKFPKKFSKPEKNQANVTREDRIDYINRKKSEQLHKRAYAAPMNVEPNMKRCICKQHRTDAEHIYDTPMKTKLPRNLQKFAAEGGASMFRPQHRGDQSKKMPPMSRLTLTTLSDSSSQ